MLIIHVYCLKTQSFPKLKECVISSVDSMTNPANNETFGQSEHDTRIWYHGTAASKVSRLCPSFPLPSPPLSSLCLPNFFLPYTLSPLRSLVPHSVYQGKVFFFVWHFIHILPQTDPSKDQKPWTSNTHSQQCMQIPSWWSQKCPCNSHIWICCKKRKS